jgi:hypothetical protein
MCTPALGRTATRHSCPRFVRAAVAVRSYEGTVHQSIISDAAFLIATFLD